ncbi:hypothetical protein [Hufsiella ginkgonis]|uniref:Uncharacterized protein n=1 Tax=Hufsiella ginkgonis TaxID=2695274 RepID=A0A7K1XV12_9SPHI|nr:hypothetical protein [Hufsiella ginkgonis]MXV14336.1 hypothetical protein [Hufsiella ginkgonis]
MSATTNTMAHEAVLTQEQFKSVQADVEYFFVNYPPKELRKLLWQLYSGWVYNSADHVTKEDIHNMLFFYEQIGDFLNDSYRLSKALNEVR